MFLQSPNYIYKAMQVGGLIDRWCKEDYISMFSALEPQGYRWDPQTQRLRQMQAISIVQTNTPWCHAKSTPEKHCSLDHNVTFANFGIIHPRCMECWKVCVTVPSFEELLKVEDLQHKMGYSSKCGMEMRDYTPKFWGAYWYTSSLDEGREMFFEVKAALKKYVSKKCADGAILKRACTEFEMVKGPSPYWHNTPQEEKMLELIESLIDIPRSNHEQSDLAKNHTRLKWVLWAHMNNDMSYVKFNGGKKLFPGYVSYHEGAIEDIKHDLALAKGQARGIKQAVGEEFLALADNFAEENDIQLTGDLIHVLGANASNPLELARTTTKQLREETPDELKGEHDELT